MRIQIPYESVLGTLKSYRLSYLTMLYANLMLHRHLTSENYANCLDTNNFSVPAHPNDVDSTIVLDAHDIQEEIAKYADLRRIDTIMSYNEVLKINAHYNRTRVLNAVFEFLKYCFYGTPHWQTFHTLDWFQVLYLLRNDASHFDNQVRYPNPQHLSAPYPAIVSWNGIIMQDKQRWNEFRYNDKQIMALVNTAIDYMTTNRADLEL